VRLATSEDSEVLLKMPPYSNSKLDFLSCRDEVLVAENDGVVYGAVSISRKDISYVDGEWRAEFEQCLHSFISKVSGYWISKLYVFPKYRYQGVATELVKEAIEHLKRKNFSEAYAGINTKNQFRPVSEHVFKKNGFKRIGSCVCFFTSGNCRGVLLKKTIGPIEQKEKNRKSFFQE
jgi:GNAT superfamily N-acetyltransferase